MINRIDRIRVIDKCLKDRTGKWTWKRLAEACSDSHRENTGESWEVCRRTIMDDIFLMRNGKLGYEAPIGYSKTNGYYYIDPDFSIHKIKLSKNNINMLTEAFQILRHLTNNERLFNINRSLTLIEQVMHMEIDPEAKPIIYFEHSLNEPGQRWLDEIYTQTVNKKAIFIQYHPFNEEAVMHLVSPAFLKEYNNRWYVFGYEHKLKIIVNLALDRIASIRPSIADYSLPVDFDHDDWFRNLYGVTKPRNEDPVKILIHTTPLLSRYMDTKPIHAVQRKLTEDQHGSTYELYLYDNYEIRSKLRSFGKDLQVIEPEGWP